MGPPSPTRSGRLSKTSFAFSAFSAADIRSHMRKRSLSTKICARRCMTSWSVEVGVKRMVVSAERRRWRVKLSVDGAICSLHICHAEFGKVSTSSGRLKEHRFTFGFIVNRSTALAVSNLTSRSVGGLFSGRSIGVIAPLLEVDLDAASNSEGPRPPVDWDVDEDL